MRARAVVIDGYDGLEGLRVDEVAVPAPRPAEVRVAIAAAGIGPWDVFTADGAFAALLDDAEHSGAGARRRARGRDGRLRPGRRGGHAAGHRRDPRWQDPRPGGHLGACAEQRGIITHTLFVQDDRGALGRLAAMLAEGTISAHVKEVVPIAEARGAYEAVAQGHVGGKLVLDPRP